LGADWNVQDLAVQPDGKILIAGGFFHIDGVSRVRVARVNSDATLDTTFNPGGADNWIETIALQSDGRILVGGWFTAMNGTVRNRVARLNANGSLDGTFDPGSGADNVIYKTVVQPDGKILVAGAFTNLRGQARNRIGRLNSNGVLDTSFNPGTGADNTIWGMGLQSDGKIIVSGAFANFNGAARSRFARLNTDGSLDNAFNVGTGGNGRANAIHFQSDGKILLGGLFTTYNGVTRNRVMRLNNNGSVDTTFDPGTGPNSTVWEMELQADGKIIVGGEFTTWNGLNRARIVRLNVNGSLDSSFGVGSGANGYVGAVAKLPDARVVIAGDFKLMNGHHRPRFAILSANGSLNPLPIVWTEWKVAEGGNGHFYALTSRAKNLNEAEAEAVATGGHLVSVNSEAEQNFLARTFLNGLDRIRPFWIGFNDVSVEGNFVWSSGEPRIYTGWEPGEPNNVGNTDYTVLNWNYSLAQGAAFETFGLWNDVAIGGHFYSSWADGPYFGIMEINGAPPTINTQPAPAIALIGTEIQLSVEASGEAPLAYQWEKDGLPISGATQSVLKIASAGEADGGEYRVFVSNRFGSRASMPATLRVINAPKLDAGQLFVRSNVSLNIEVPIGIRAIVEFSNDLINWATVSDNVTTASILTVIHQNAAGEPMRFYRLKLLP
jgi:uncharacterized delta-60 repeat protein